MIGVGLIKIEIEGLTPEELDRCKTVIDTLFIRRVFNLRNGSAELHFDNDGVLKGISYKTQWSRDKELPTRPLAENYKAPIVTVIAPTLT